MSFLYFAYLTFGVANIDEVCADCEAAGVAFERPKLELRPGLTLALIQDPDETTIEFVERR